MYVMKKVIRLTEGDLIGMVKRVLMESESEYVIYGEADHLGGKGKFIYTGDGGFSLIPNTKEFRRRMDDVFPEVFNNRKECEKTIRLLRKHRQDIRWYIETL
jgi:hypothetical protein